MLWFLLIGGVVQCLLLLWLLRTGGRLNRESLLAAPRRKRWPSAALIVPAAGEHPMMQVALRSLLMQDYPGLLPIFVTATEDEPAAKLVRELQKDFPVLRHVVAGKAEDCGQKNHNSLAGITAAGDTVDLLLFCDSTHLARPDFARHLAAPVADGQSDFSTGYHTVLPRDNSLVTLGYAFCVQLMRYLQGLTPSFTQPWGGAMCIRRSVFEHMGLRRFWQENVVDDCSLAGLLPGLGKRVILSPGALLHTEAEHHSFRVWRAWMDRQVLFLKFCVPSQWLLLGVLPLVMILPPAVAAVAVIGMLCGMVPVATGLPALALLLWLTLLLHGWRCQICARGSLWRWLAAYVLSAALFAEVYLRTIPARGILWHGIWYRVGRGGRVLEMRCQ